MSAMAEHEVHIGADLTAKFDPDLSRLQGWMDKQKSAKSRFGSASNRRWFKMQFMSSGSLLGRRDGQAVVHVDVES